MSQTNETLKRNVVTGRRATVRVKTIAFVGLMGALSAILMLLRFPIPFMPPFMSFDLSGVMEMLGGYMFGPGAAFCIILVKILLQLVIQGSLSLGTGEIQNLILSSCYVLPAVFLYYRNKTKKRAVAGMAVSTVLVAVVAVFTNLYMIIPFYANLMGNTMDDFVAMCTAVNPMMKDALTMALFGIVPFNLIKYGATSVVTFLLYKKLSRFIKGVIER
ncbi:MAG: ECF transporter S component [Lachnospiraceae bacterium]